MDSTFLLYEIAGYQVTSFLLGLWRFHQKILPKFHGVHVFKFNFRRSQLFITRAIWQGTQNLDYFECYCHFSIVVKVWKSARRTNSLPCQCFKKRFALLCRLKFNFDFWRLPDYVLFNYDNMTKSFIVWVYFLHQFPNSHGRKILFLV